MSDDETVICSTDVRLLTAGERAGYLELLLRGGNPAAICVELGVSYSSVLLTLRNDPEFRSADDDTRLLQAENVAAAVYRQAMKGSVPAMTLYLRNRPPIGWGENEESDETIDEYERMSDAELLERARAEGVAIPPAFARGFEAADGAVLPE